MSRYCVDWNTGKAGDQSIHRRDYCPTAPSEAHRVDLGEHDSLDSAMGIGLAPALDWSPFELFASAVAVWLFARATRWVGRRSDTGDGRGP